MKQEDISALSSLISSSDQLSRQSNFDAVVSNPPYQASSNSKNNIEGRDTEVTNVFQSFYELSSYFSQYSTMIFPGGRWMQRSHGNNSISNLIFSTVSEILWYPNGEERNIQPVFNHAAISDGVSIVLFNKEKINDDTIFVNNCKINRPKDKEIVPLSAAANSILSKLDTNNTLNSRKLETNVFRLGTNWVEQNPDQVIEYNEISFTKPENTVIAYLGNKTPGKNKRVQKYWLKKDNVQWTENLTKIYNSWKIVCSQGQVSKRPATSSYRIVEPKSVIGASWMILGVFDTLEETVNYKKYIDTSFTRFLIEESRGGKSGKWGAFVPDLEDYTRTNSLIDWDQDLDEQLFEIFKLSETEQGSIKSKNFNWLDKKNI